MELREKIGRAILDAMDVQDGLDAEAAAKYADAILAIPEIRDALKLADTLPEREKRLRLL
jgi:DNA-directed RNA polymerase subunit F